MTNPNNFDIFSAGVQGILDVGDAIAIQSFYETQCYYHLPFWCRVQWWVRTISLKWPHNERLTSPASRLFTQSFIQGADQRKHQSSALLAFVRGIHRWPVNSPHKGPVTWERVSIWWRHHVLDLCIHVSSVFIWILQTCYTPKHVCLLREMIFPAAKLESQY